MQLEQLIKPLYPKLTRAGYQLTGIARMPRMYAAEQYFGLSDKDIEHPITIAGLFVTSSAST